MKKFRVLLLTVGTAAFALAQVPAAKLSFEVASIKPSGQPDQQKILAGQQKVGMSVDKARVDIGLTPLIALIMQAYKIQLTQIQGPPFLMTDRWDIVAKMPEGATKEQVPEMLQSLLADRFGLKYHLETKDQSAYVLSQAKGGSKLVEAGSVEALDEDARNKAAAKGETVMNAGDSQVRMKQDQQGGMTATVKGGENGTVKQTMTPDGLIHIDIQSMTIEQLCQQVSILVQKPVVDHTELKGKYSMAIEFRREDIMALVAAMGGAANGNGATSGSASNNQQANSAADPLGGGNTLIKSVEKLGLKMELTKTAVSQMIIDHIDKTPSDN